MATDKKKFGLPNTLFGARKKKLTSDDLEGELFFQQGDQTVEMTLKDLESKEFFKKKKAASIEQFHRANPNSARFNTLRVPEPKEKKRVKKKFTDSQSLEKISFSGSHVSNETPREKPKESILSEKKLTNRSPDLRSKISTDSKEKKKKNTIIQSVAGLFGKKKCPPNFTSAISEIENRESIPFEAVLKPESPDDLPSNLQKILYNSKIPMTLSKEEFEIVQSILYFQTKTKFYCVEEKRKIQKEQSLALPVKIMSTKCRPPSDLKNLIKKDDPLNNYRIEKQEGKGGFGTVYRAYMKKDSTKNIAIKVLPHFSARDQSANLAEISTLSFCKHPNIVQYFDSYLVDKEIWCVMEFLQGGSLSHAIKSYTFSESQIAYLAQETLKGIEYLHSLNIVHRDLKSANVMLSVEAEIKIIDFGLSTDLNSGAKTSMVGSPYWVPPEMIHRKPYTEKVDIYSFGICLMELANGHPPHSGCSTKAMFIAATQGYPNPFEKPERFSKECSEFYKACLRIDPSTRPSATELLSMPFLKRADSQDLMKQVLSGIFISNAILPF